MYALVGQKNGDNYVHVFFADFSKGFDLIDHNILITELLGVHICIKKLDRRISNFKTSARHD